MGAWCRPNLGPRNSVSWLARIVYVVLDSRAGIGITSVEVEVLVGNRRTRAGDFNLHTAGIELGTTYRVEVESGISFVEGNDLLTDQIFASRKGGRQSEVLLALVCNELVNSPQAAVEALFGNLGPDPTGTVALGVRSDVSDDWSMMRARNDVVVSIVMVPFESEFISCRDGYKFAHRLCTIDITDEVGTGEVLHGIVVGR